MKPVTRCLARSLLIGHRELRDSVILLPIGSFEDRPAGAMGLDTLLATWASCIAAEGRGWLVAPPLAYGYSPLHAAWAGPRSPRVLEEFLQGIIAGLYSAGAGHVAAVDGHLGHAGYTARAAEAAGASYHNLWLLAEERDLLDLVDWDRLLRLEEELVEAARRGEAHPFVEKLAALLAESIEEAAEGPQ